MLDQANNFFSSHPFCCFCGGTIPATEIEHQPSKIIFPNKHRPKGMEYPSCKRCNEQTRYDELIIAFLCRMLGSGRSENPPDKRFQKVLRSINLRFPNLLNEMNQGRMWVRTNGVLVRRGGINVNIPQVNFSVCRIAAKIALARYYEFYGKIADEACLINTFWTHNQKSFSDVDAIIRMFSNSAAIVQGKWNSEDSFFLKYSGEGGNVAVVAVYYESLALIGYLTPNVTSPIQNWQYVWTPTAADGLKLAVNPGGS